MKTTNHDIHTNVRGFLNFDSIYSSQNNNNKMDKHFVFTALRWESEREKNAYCFYPTYNLY